LPFTFLADFTVVSPLQLNVPIFPTPQCGCTYFPVPGAGTATFTIVPDSHGIPDAFDIDQINYTFNQSVPTPSTASLMLLSLVVLAGMGWKRASAAR
jgi:IPTL-CTERM motif